MDRSDGGEGGQREGGDAFGCLKSCFGGPGESCAASEGAEACRESKVWHGESFVGSVAGVPKEAQVGGRESTGRFAKGYIIHLHSHRFIELLSTTVAGTANEAEEAGGATSCSPGVQEVIERESKGQGRLMAVSEWIPEHGKGSEEADLLFSEAEV